MRSGFKTPTPIQKSSLPSALKGKDVVGVAETVCRFVIHQLLLLNVEKGSGKTLAYGLPILQHLLIHPHRSSRKGKRTGRRLKALVLTPTRELALQVAIHLRTCAEETSNETEGGIEEGKRNSSRKKPPRVSIAAVVGGMSAQKQRRVLERGVDIVIATPGRLWDLLQEVSNCDVTWTFTMLKHT